MRLVISTLGEITQQANSLLSRSFGRKGANIRTQKTNLLVLSLTNTRCNSLYALGQAAREHCGKTARKQCRAELVSASHLVRLLDTILSRSGAQASLEVTVRCISYFVLLPLYFRSSRCLYSLFYSLLSPVNQL